MTSRTLPPEEWPRLQGTLFDTIWTTFDPAWAEVIVVESGGRIVASVALLNILHAECLSVAGGLAAGRALWIALSDRVRERGGRAVWAAADDTPMHRLLMRHAQPVAGHHFLLSVKEQSPCLQS